jgi:hypothetical protein
MKSSVAIPSLQEEFFVVRVDGRINSSYQRFVDALRAGLQLKAEFPGHDVKVRSAHRPAKGSADLH